MMKKLMKSGWTKVGIGVIAGYLLRDQIAKLLPAGLAPTAGLGALLTNRGLPTNFRCPPGTRWMGAPYGCSPILR